MKFNWLMVLPFVLFLGIAGIWLWQLQNNQFALQQGVDTTALRSAQQGHPAPDLDLDPLADKPLLTRDMLEGRTSSRSISSPPGARPAGWSTPSSRHWPRRACRFTG
jgi:hypothetical protein